MPSADLNTNGSQNNTDLLADILGGSSSPPATSAPSKQQSNMSSIMDLFDSSAPSQLVGNAPAGTMLSGMSSPPPQPAAPSIPSHPCYDKNNLHIIIQIQRNAEGIVQVMARFKNTSMHQSISAIALQAAVPKTQKLQLNAMSNPELSPGAEATQSMRITGTKGVSSKISFIAPC